MATPNPQPVPRRRLPDLSAWSPGRRAWLWFVPAFALGLLLFFLMIRKSGDEDFFRAGTVPPTTAERDYAPLPAPLPAGEGSGIEPLPPPPPPPVAEQRVEPVRPAPPVEARPIERERERPVATVRDRKPRPLPGRTPPPDYPARALMRGEGGTSLVIAHIGPDGVPTAVEIAQSSGSRDLDRAAMQAVRRWRFEPAIADGVPTVGQVVVPIDFQP